MLELLSMVLIIFASIREIKPLVEYYLKVVSLCLLEQNANTSNAVF